MMDIIHAFVSIAMWCWIDVESLGRISSEEMFGVLTLER